MESHLLKQHLSERELQHGVFYKMLLEEVLPSQSLVRRSHLRVFRPPGEACPRPLGGAIPPVLLSSYCGTNPCNSQAGVFPVGGFPNSPFFNYLASRQVWLQGKESRRLAGLFSIFISHKLITSWLREALGFGLLFTVPGGYPAGSIASGPARTSQPLSSPGSAGQPGSASSR